MEYHPDVAEAKDSSPANTSISYINSKFLNHNSTDKNESFELINETPENHSIAERSNYCLFAITSKPDVNSQSEDNSSDSDGSFEIIDDTSDDAVYGIVTKSGNDSQNIFPISFYDSEESNNSVTATNDPSEDYPTYDEPFELIYESSEDFVYVKESKILNDSRNVPSNSTSCMETCDIAENKKYDCTSNSSILDMNFLSADSDESFELIDKTSVKLLCAKETEHISSPQNVSSCSISNMESVHDTVFDNKYYSPIEVCTNDDKPKEESKFSALIVERKKDSASENSAGVSGRMCSEGSIMKGLVKGIKNCAITEKEFLAPNKNHNDQLKSNVLIHDTRSNPESKNPFYIPEKKHVSILENMFIYDKEMCSDMKKVIKEIKNHSIMDKKFNSNIAFEKKHSDELKIKPIVNKHNLVLPKNNLTSIINERCEPKCSETCMISKGREKSCDKHICPSYDITDGVEEKVEVQESLSSKHKIIFVTPKVPKAVLMLRSKCLGYLNKPRQTDEDKNVFKSDYSVLSSDEGNRNAQEREMRDLAKEQKDEKRKERTKNVNKWIIEEENISSWTGFEIDNNF